MKFIERIKDKCFLVVLLGLGHVLGKTINHYYTGNIPEYWPVHGIAMFAFSYIIMGMLLDYALGSLSCNVRQMI